MSSYFSFQDKKIILKNNGECYGYLKDTCYNIGEKLFEFIKLDYEDIDKLKKLYDKLIYVVIEGKFNNLENNLYRNMSEVVYKCLEFSPYTHFYTQLLIDTIIKTYNMNFIRSDLIIKSGIDFYFNEGFNDEEYEMYDTLLEKEEEKMNPLTMMNLCFQKVEEISDERKNEFLVFFKEVKKALISDFIKKKNEVKDRIVIMGEYSNEKVIRDLTPEQRIYLYELKGVFDLNYYLNMSPANTIFLDTTFKTKYIVNERLSREDKELNIIDLAKKIKKEDIEVKEVYELDNAEEQIRLEIFKVIANNIIIKKCDNCEKLFIPDKTDQIYCNNLYKSTGKTCKEIGALNKRKEKVKNSKILKEYNREYKRMYGLHYNHQKEFKEKKFKEWSLKARELRNLYSDNDINVFKIELKKLSNLYWKINEK